MEVSNWRWLPNAITLTRCGLALLIGWLILDLQMSTRQGPIPLSLAVSHSIYLHIGPASWVLALYILTALSDFLDGFLARKLNATSAFGAFLDPIADKLLVAISLLAICHVEGWTLFLVLPTLFIICRDLAITLIRLIPSVTLPVSRLAKYKTACEMLAIGLILLAYAWPELSMVAHDYLFAEVQFLDMLPLYNLIVFNFGLVLVWLAAGLAVWTGLLYIKAFLRR